LLLHISFIFIFIFLIAIAEDVFFYLDALVKKKSLLLVANKINLPSSHLVLLAFSIRQKIPKVTVGGPQGSSRVFLKVGFG
jgi:hypothetical protein